VTDSGTRRRLDPVELLSPSPSLSLRFRRRSIPVVSDVEGPGLLPAALPSPEAGLMLRRDILIIY
jgi:hypothetical protein